MSDKKTQMPKCPPCNTAKNVKPFGLTGTLFHCSKCHGTFEPDGEGGDYSDRNPAARLEREERRRQSRFARRS